MIVTAFISMWITNTATTAMMCPIMEAVLKQLDMQFMRDGLDEIENEENEDDQESQYKVNSKLFYFAHLFIVMVFVSFLYFLLLSSNQTCRGIKWFKMNPMAAQATFRYLHRLKFIVKKKR